MKPSFDMTARPGVALLAVLMIVMVITIMALSFLSRSDVELACGENMALRTQMDYLAESGLEHARGLILNPQDVSAEYWMGESLQQLVAGSDDYYDLTVTRDDTDRWDRCNYIIDCNSYRLSGGEKIGRSDLRATLRLDPAIAYWAGSDTTVSDRIRINGDVYCNGDLVNYGRIDGDVFASGTISGWTIIGQMNPATEAPVTWPGLRESDFGPTYYYGAASYSADIVDVNVHTLGNFAPSATNPSGIRYRSGDLELQGDVSIVGMLVVDGELRVSGTDNSITAVKNYPAFLVTGRVVMEDRASLEITGLAQIGQRITFEADAGNVDVDVVGALFIANGGIEGIESNSNSVNITSAPAIASLEIWPTINTSSRWGPASGAFFKSVERQ